MSERKRLSAKKLRKFQAAVRAWIRDQEANTSGYLPSELELFKSWWLRSH